VDEALYTSSHRPPLFQKKEKKKKKNHRCFAYIMGGIVRPMTHAFFPLARMCIGAGAC